MEKPQKPRPPIAPKPKPKPSITPSPVDTKTTTTDNVVSDIETLIIEESPETPPSALSKFLQMSSSLQSLETADGSHLPSTPFLAAKNGNNNHNSAALSSPNKHFIIASSAAQPISNDCIVDIHFGNSGADNDRSSSLLVSTSDEGNQLRPPPRTKKMIKIKQQQRSEDHSTVEVTMRDKEQSATANRSSKPPRGTIMLAMNGLLSKAVEPSSPARSSCRPVPRPRSKSGSFHVETENQPASSLALSKSFRSVLFNPPPYKNPRDKLLNSVPVPKPRNSLLVASDFVVRKADSSGQSKNHADLSGQGLSINEETVEDKNKSAESSVTCQAEVGARQKMEPLTTPNIHTAITEPLLTITSHTDPLKAVTSIPECSRARTYDIENHYGHVWTNEAHPNTESIKDSQSNQLTRTVSMPITISPKVKPRRPSERPPPPPGAAKAKNIKKLGPSRPPPPVPKDQRKLDNLTNVDIGLSTANSESKNKSMIKENGKEHTADLGTADGNIYTDIDEDCMLPLDVYVDPTSVPANLQSENATQQVKDIPEQSDSEDEMGEDAPYDNNMHGDDVYLSPEKWPERTAPPPPPPGTFPDTPAQAAEDLQSKSATLQSFSSNVYEDVDSSSDDEPSKLGSSEPIDDIYSDNLDETFNNEDDLKVGSSSESEAETEESIEAKLAKQRDRVFKVAQEIATTEEEFCDKLVLLNIDFRKHVSSAAEEHGVEVLPSKCMNSILNYLPQLAIVNEDLLKDLKQRIDNWDTDPRIADVFVRKGAYLQMYATYIRDFQNMTTELDNAIRDYPLFAETLKTFENSERCRNLQLRHYMLKPIQRIPQYRLLLNEYRKYLPADSPDSEDAQKALEIVSKVADHANEAMKENDSFQSLLELQSLLIGDFKVIEPSRVLVRKGDVFKQSRKELQPRTLFLFNDYLVITSPQAGGYFRIKHVLPLLNMRVEKPVQQDFHKEFTIITKKKSFKSVTFMPHERDEWVTILQSTITERERKIDSYNAGLIEQSGSKEHRELGAVAPVWIADDRVSMCMTCSSSFTLINRRHHCRACGQVVCGLCSSYRAPLKYDEYRPKRVCGGCYNKLFEEASSKNGFMNKPTARPSPRPKQRGVLQEVQANDIGDLSGYLSLSVHHKKKVWERYWFVLKEKVLYKYNACEDRAAIESKPLLGYKVAQVGTSHEGLDKNVMFRLFHPAIDIVDPILFKTETAAAAERWIEKMQESTTA